MPTVTINRKVLDKILGKKLPDDKLKDRISMIGTDLEHLDEDEIIVEIFPNRPDMLSEQGFGRALSSFLGIKTGLRKYDVKKSGAKVFVSKDMKNVRPYTVCALIKNLKLDDEKVREIIQIQEKLHITFCRKRKKAAIGIYPLEKIKLPIYFNAKKPKDIVFRPLEWNNEINAEEILLQHPTGIEYKHLVKDMKKYAVFEDANGEVLSFTPIINSHKTGKITDQTKEAFLEVSGSDLHTAQYVLNIMVTSLADMGAEIYSMEVVYPDKTLITPNLEPRKMEFDLGFINKWLGLELKEKGLKELLERMGFGYEKQTALIPAYRPDIIHPADLAEDIAIAYGYENFTPILPTKATAGAEDSFEKFRKKVAQILVGLNMLECSTYHITNEKTQLKDMKIKADDHIVLANSISEEYNILRYGMLAELMNVLRNNTHNEYPQNIFESGYVFKKGKNDTGVIENNKLAVMLCSAEADYTKARQVLDYLFRTLGFESYIRKANSPSFIEGRAGKVLLDGNEIGMIGEIVPEVLENFGVEMPASGFEIDLGKIFKSMSMEDNDFIADGDFLISTEIKSRYPSLSFISLKINDIVVTEHEKRLDEKKKKLIAHWKDADLESDKNIQDYRRFHKELGLSETAAAESIISRYLKKGEFPNINSAVDAANIVSIENLTSLGLFDLDKIKGNIKIRLSRKGDEYLPYGAKAKQKIAESHIIMEDDEKVFAVIGYKDSQETKVDLQTKNLLVLTWGRKSDVKGLNDVLSEVSKLVKS